MIKEHKTSRKQSKATPTSYQACRQRKISTTMKEFKKGELKSSSGKRVKDPSQATAIALSQATRQCEKKYSMEDHRKLRQKVKEFLDGNEPLTATRVRDTKRFIQKLPTSQRASMEKKLHRKIISYMARNGDATSQRIAKAAL